MRKIILLALLAACGGTSGTNTGGGNSTGGGTGGGGSTDGGTPVTIEWNFTTGGGSGATTTVDAGTPIRWHNSDTFVHSVVPATSPPPAATNNLAPGSTSQDQTISTPGTYHYICGIHGTAMKGTLIVQ